EYFFFFQAEDGIRDFHVTEVQTCALPILVTWENGKSFELGPFKGYLRDYSINEVGPAEVTFAQVDEAKKRGQTIYSKVDTFASRSEERRVGKESRCRGIGHRAYN